MLELFNIINSMSKRKIIFVLITFLLVIGSIVYFLFFKKPAEQPSLVPSEEKIIEEILKDLTAPLIGEKPEVPEEVTKSLTAPEGGEISEDILQSLTAPK